MTWIEKILNDTKEIESPERYFYWAACSALASVMNKNVWIDKYTYKLYPNIFVFLTGDSGLRKGLPVSLAAKLVEPLGVTRVFRGRGSVQGVIHEMSKVYTNGTGKILKDAYGFICSGEFSSFLVKDPDALTILTDLYDCHFNSDWRGTLKSTPTEKLENFCLTILGASNDVHLPDIIPKNATGGGFIARTFIVNEERKRTVNSLMYEPTVKLNLTDLTKHLQDISRLKGEFKISNEARKFHHEWYISWCKKVKNDPTGTVERIHDSILKVAMFESVSERLDMEITKDHIQRATARCLECIPGMKRVLIQDGVGEFSGKTKRVLDIMLRRHDHKITRQNLLRRGWGDFDAIDLNRVVETLEQAGAIKSSTSENNRDIVYELTEYAVKLYTNFTGE